MQPHKQPQKQTYTQRTIRHSTQQEPLPSCLRPHPANATFTLRLSLAGLLLLLCSPLHHAVSELLHVLLHVRIQRTAQTTYWVPAFDALEPDVPVLALGIGAVVSHCDISEQAGTLALSLIPNQHTIGRQDAWSERSVSMY